MNKSFGPIDVLHDINLEVRAGEVLCLPCDNGAGKSTLIGLMSGVHQPTSGQILLDGQPVHFPPPPAASEAGIVTVHQFGGTLPLMSIGCSFFVGVKPPKGWGPFKLYDRKKANEIAVKAVQSFGITRIDDGDRLVGGLSGGERQSLAIARAVHFGALTIRGSTRRRFQEGRDDPRGNHRPDGRRRRHGQTRSRDRVACRHRRGMTFRVLHQP